MVATADLQTNAARVRRARIALVAYAGAAGETVGPESVGDLLADLHHLLAAQGDADPSAAMEHACCAAAEHFLAETTDASEPPIAPRSAS